MKFEEAFKMMKQGAKVKLPGWNGYSNFAYRFYLCTLKIQYLAGIRLSKFYPLPYAA